MSGLETLRSIALAFPDVSDESDHEGPKFTVRGKVMVGPYRARPAPKAKRVPVDGVVAIRCPMERKELLIEAAPDRFFDDDHFRGYPAVLVRLSGVDEAELRALVEGAWRMQAPKRRVKAERRSAP